MRATLEKAAWLKADAANEFEPGALNLQYDDNDDLVIVLAVLELNGHEYEDDNRQPGGTGFPDPQNLDGGNVRGDRLAGHGALVGHPQAVD